MSDPSAEDIAKYLEGIHSELRSMNLILSQLSQHNGQTVARLTAIESLLTSGARD